MSVVVRITFKKIQKFLFAVPRLKAMLGANAQIAEVIRLEMAKLAIDCGSVWDGAVDLAKIDCDPLAMAIPAVGTSGTAALEQDCPSSMIRQGVVSREGGHFRAVFPNQTLAGEFVDKASALLVHELPGLEYEVDCSSSTQNLHGQAAVRLPDFRVCQDTGTDVAADISGKSARSSRVVDFEVAGDRFYKGDTNDIIALLGRAGQLPASGLERPNDLKALAENGYLALIHADGNAIGHRYRSWTGTSRSGVGMSDQVEVETEIEAERFYYPMRVAVRHAVITALQQTYDDDVLKRYEKVRPYQLLMLGGDDLVMLCKPREAFRFVIEYARALADSSVPVPFGRDDGEVVYRPLSIGAGICIAHHNLPFYHLQQVAEELASSAKKLYREQQAVADGMPPERSVVDWTVSTASWVESPVETRKRTDMYAMDIDGTRETLLTAGRPCFVLNPKQDESGSPGLDSLETLESAARCVGQSVEGEEGAARSQLKRLAGCLQQGRKTSEVAYSDMPEATRCAMQEYFGEYGENLWEDLRGDIHLSRFKDLLELVEVERLGRG